MSMLEGTVIHTIRVIGGTGKGMHDMQTRIKNKSYLTAIYISGNWDQKYNSHENHPQDINKSPQYSQIFGNLINK